MADICAEMPARSLLPSKWSPGAGRKPHSKHSEGPGIARPAPAAGGPTGEPRATTQRATPRTPRHGVGWGIRAKKRAARPASGARKQQCEDALDPFGNPLRTLGLGVPVTAKRLERTEHSEIAAAGVFVVV